MRVIAGSLKGRTLASFNLPHIRPMSDMVKESLFNIINFHIQGSEILDLFSGTGNLSIEAISRGAKSVVSVDSNQKSVDVIKKNIEKFNLEDSISVYKQDVFKFLKTCDRKFDIVFVDPPFTKKISDKILTAVSNSNVAKRGCLITIQVSKHDSIKESYKNLSQISKKTYSDKFLVVFKHNTD